VSSFATRRISVAIFLALSSSAIAAERLRVGTSGDYPPFSVGASGFDVDVARLFAANLGMEIDWVRFAWPELTDRVRAGHFDVVMSGVTWRPERDPAGWMSRAVAVGGPCVVGAAAPSRIAVNRGGVLERFARDRFDERLLFVVDDNRSLPQRLMRGEVDAVVTDSFEKSAFPASAPARCEPHRDRKVYWISPARAESLGPRLDQWLATNERRLEALRARHLGTPAPRDELDHLVDLVGRRLALMPAVVAAKRARGLPVEDPAQEERMLARVGQGSPALVPFFATQIALAKRVQERASEAPPSLDLERELRPALERLDGRIVGSLARNNGAALDRSRLAILEGLLTVDELEGLERSLRTVLASPPPDGR
jgi:cyclohexadienyl dehydratase